MMPGNRNQVPRYCRELAVLLLIALLVVSPAAAEICWGKVCSSSLLKDLGLCTVCCSGHGTCESFNNCVCDEGWTGKECGTPTFCGSCPNFCNTTSTGICSVEEGGYSGKCLCTPGYSGDCCTVKVANPEDATSVLVPSSYEFGNVTIGSASVLPGTAGYVNEGLGWDRVIDNVTISGANAGDFAVGTLSCGSSMRVGPKGTCTIPVNFTPSAAGSRTATLTVFASVYTPNTSLKDTRSYTMSMSGTGISPVNTIVVDPASPSHVFAGIEGAGIYRSTNSGGSWLPATLTPAILRVKVLVLKPGTGSTLYAGTYGSGVYKSTDSGATWTACANTGLANKNVLALVSNSTGGLFAGTEDGVYTSTDCDTWTGMNSGLP